MPSKMYTSVGDHHCVKCGRLLFRVEYGKNGFVGIRGMEYYCACGYTGLITWGSRKVTMIGKGSQ